MTIQTDEYSFEKIQLTDAPALLDIINYYIETSTSNFSDRPRDRSYIENLINNKSDLPKFTIKKGNEIIGFGYAYVFRPEESFAETVKFTYWLRPDFTGQGLGERLYNLLENVSKKNGIKNVLVNISSENERSIRFHEKQGFTKCGHFRQIANKQGKFFDIIWLQKTLV